MLSRLLDVVRRSLAGDRLNREIQEEIEQHIELRAEHFREQGLDAGEAMRRARLEFGSTAARTEECREERELLWFDEARRNVVFAVRQLRKNPAFAISAVLTLGLCIGANTAIFSAVDAVLMKPLAFPNVERLGLLAVQLNGSEYAAPRTWHDGRAWEAVRDHAESVDAAVFKRGSSGRNLAVGGDAEFVLQQRVGAGFFRVLGIPPAEGREFNGEEDRPGGATVTVLSHELAARLFNAAADAVGRTVNLKGEPHLVVGVMPYGFVSSQPADIWTPLRPSTRGEGEGANYQILVRARGPSLAEAEAAMAPLTDEIFDTSRLNVPEGVEVTARVHLLPLQEGLTQQQERPLALLWAAVAAVLLIGCVNIAGLLIARLESRSRELALRRSLGGGRAAVARQLLTESVVLGLSGGLAGAVIGYVSLGALRGLLREGFSIWQPIALDLRALAATAAVSIGCGLVFGFYPAWRGSRLNLGPILEHGSRATGGRGAGWTRRVLVVGQLAVCLLLLSGAGLMIRTFDGLRSLEPGFDPRGVVVGDVSLDDARYATAKAASRLFQTALDRVRETPGVQAAGAGHSLPYERAVNLGFHVVGEESRRTTDLVYVAGNYFEALGVPLLRGRRLRTADEKGASRVVVVNRAFAGKYVEGDVLATYLSLGGGERRIVGVVGDVQHRPGWGGLGPLSPTPTVYLPVAQMEDRALALINTWSTPSFVVRSTGSAQETTASIRDAVGSVDPLLPFAGFRTMEQVQGQGWARQRVQATLLGILAGLALTLAAVGIYGLIASVAAERTREAAIRMALGAASWRVAWNVALSGLMLASIGVGIGLLLVPASGQLIEGLIWGVEPGDPATLGAGAVVLVFTAACASLGPVMRLLRIQPAALLREE